MKHYEVTTALHFFQYWIAAENRYWVAASSNIGCIIRYARHRRPDADIEAVAEILSDITAQEPLYESLSDIPDIERTAGRIALRSIRPKEAAALRDAIPKLAELARTLKAFRSPLIRDYAQDLQIPASIWKVSGRYATGRACDIFTRR